MKNEYKAVSNSTPLIYLAKINKLKLFRELFHKVFIPESVYIETVVKGKKLEMPDAVIIEKAVNDWIVREGVKEEVREKYGFVATDPKLGLGEKDALLLCKQLNADYLLADDKEARRVAKLLNITPIGTYGAVIAAYKRGIIDGKTAIKIVTELMKAGLRISVQLYQLILDEISR